MKRIVLILLLIILSIFFNGVQFSNANTNNTVNENENSLLLERIAELERTNFLYLIELESEIILPDYLDYSYIKFIYDTSVKLEVPIRIAFRLIYKESNFKTDVKSSAGAMGIMQLMPETKNIYSKKLRVDTLNYDETQKDIYIGLYYLRENYLFWKSRNNSEKFSWKLSLATYNAGIKPVLEYKNVPPYKETENFVNFVLKPHSNQEFLTNFNKKYGNKIKNYS